MTQKLHSASPLRFVEHHLSRLSLEVAQKVDAEGVFGLKTNRKVTKDTKDPRRWRVEMEVEFGPGEPAKATPYSGAITFTGTFEVAESYPVEKREDLVAVTGASILYGACREMIANLTARAKYGLLSLPAITLLKPEKKIESDKATEASEATPSIKSRRPKE